MHFILIILVNGKQLKWQLLTHASRSSESKKALFIEHFMKTLSFSLSLSFFLVCVGIFRAHLRTLFRFFRPFRLVFFFLWISFMSFHWIAHCVAQLPRSNEWWPVTDRRVDVPLQLFWRLCVFLFDMNSSILYVFRWSHSESSNFYRVAVEFWFSVDLSNSKMHTNRGIGMCLFLCIIFGFSRLFMSFPFLHWRFLPVHRDASPLLTLLLMLQLNKWQITRKMHDICRSL